MTTTYTLPAAEIGKETVIVWAIVSEEYCDCNSRSWGVVSGTPDQVETHLRQIAVTEAGDIPTEISSRRSEADDDSPAQIEVSAGYGEAWGVAYTATMTTVQEL